MQIQKLSPTIDRADGDVGKPIVDLTGCGQKGSIVPTQQQ